MNKLEKPVLGIKTMNAPPHSWIARGIREEDLVLSLQMDDGSMFPGVVPHYWKSLKPNEIEFDLPSAVYNFVILNEVLECYDSEHKKKLIKECKRVTKNGGIVAAVSKCCHHGQELFDLVRMRKINIDKFCNRRLSNKDIAVLQPSAAVFFSQTIISPNRRRLLEVMNNMGIDDVDLERMWGFPEKLAINSFYVGLKWGVQR